MKLYRIGAPGAETPVAEIDGTRYDVSTVGDFTPQFWAEDGVARIRQAVEDGTLTPLESADDARYGSPVVAPTSVICIGQNYAAHAAESGAEPPKHPIVFFKTPNTVAGPHDPVAIPTGSVKTDWEVELCIVVGRQAFALQSVEEARECIGGYVLANDLSERTYQIEVSGGQWSKGKCLPGYMPLGPWTVTPDEFDPADVAIRSWVNGEPRQDSRTSDMIFDCATLVQDLSQYMQLEPGDVISTGTPEGVAFSGRFPYLTPGDTVRLEIEGLGVQEQQFTAWKEQ